MDAHLYLTYSLPPPPPQKKRFDIIYSRTHRSNSRLYQHTSKVHLLLSLMNTLKHMFISDALKLPELTYMNCMQHLKT